MKGKIHEFLSELLSGSLRRKTGGEPEVLEQSDWFDDELTTRVRQAALRRFTKLFEERLAEAVEMLGPPLRTSETHGPEIAAWYPEAMRAACWQKDRKIICLTLEQHDQETPLAVVLHFLTPAQIRSMSG